MLLLAFLISTSEQWQGAAISLKSVVMASHMTRTEILLRNMVQNARILAHIQVYSPPEDEGEVGKTRGFLIQNYRKPLKLSSRFVGLFKKSKQKKRNLTEQYLKEVPALPLVDENSALLQPEDMAPRLLNDGEKAESLMSRQVNTADEDAIIKHIDNIIIENSTEADLVILGFNLPAEGKEHAYVSRMDHLTEQLPTTLLVHAGFDIDLFS